MAPGQATFCSIEYICKTQNMLTLSCSHLSLSLISLSLSLIPSLPPLSLSLFRLSLCWIPPPFVQINLVPLSPHTHTCTHNTHTQHTHTLPALYTPTCA